MTARPAIQQLLPMGISLFCFDFSGCAQSEGPYVSMGFFEREDVDAAMRYLQSTHRVSQIALWGRSMGAATTLLYCGDF
jgi:alpha/beta superfamily hydrolase